MSTVISFLQAMDISLSRWVLVPAGFCFLLCCLMIIPNRIQFYLRQRPFRRPENSCGYIRDESTLTRSEKFAFELERWQSPYYNHWELYKGFLNRIDVSVMGYFVATIVVSTILNALGY